MKKVIGFVAVILILICSFTSQVFATSDVDAQEVLNSDSTSQLIKISEDQKEELEDYKVKYGSDAYGLTAFILNKIRIFSIPFCFLGIVISAVYQYVIGIRKLDVRYKGFYTMIAFITLFVIAQVLPLVFVIVIKGFGRS